MTLVVYDRVKETTTVAGTGTATLLGAQTGYQSFAVVGTGNTTPYYIADQSGVNWEVGIGTYTASGTTLARTTVLSSSNAGALVVFPAGTKDVGLTYPAETSVSGGGGGTYPTIQPTLNLDFANTKLLDPRITFVRNSTATYYDGQTTAMAEQNLLTYSQAFSNVAWSISNISVTADTTIAPDGTTTADQILEAATTATHSISTSIGSVIGNATLSVYAKPNGRYLVLAIQASGLGSANFVSAVFDLVGGTVVNTNGLGGQTYLSSTITASTNGFYRCSVSGTMSASATAMISLSDVTTAPTGNYGRNTYLGIITSGVYLWGAQLEQRSSATAYTPTTTAAITNYIPVLMTAPAGVARFDCDPITRNSLGLLIEESRTNLALQSAFASGWVTSNSSIITNTIIAPDGTLTGAKLVEDSATSTHRIYQLVTPSGAVAHTISVYVKAAGRGFLILEGQSNFGGGYMWFNLSTGTIGTSGGGAGGADGTITSVGDGWFRCTLRVTATGTTASQFGIWSAATNGVTSYTGDGYSGIYIWGAQVEAGSFATSYIPTVASTVTRATDQASMTGTNFSSWYNQAQGTMYFEGDLIGFGGVTNYRLLNGPVELYIPGGSQLYCGNPIIGNALSTLTANSIFKAIIAIAPTSTYIFKGALVGTSSTPFSGTPTVLGIGSIGGSSQTICGHIRKISYYPIALSSSNLVALTS